MIIPGMVPVVDDGGTKAPSGVDTSSGDGNCGQMYQKHGEPNWQWG